MIQLSPMISTQCLPKVAWGQGFIVLSRSRMYTRLRTVLILSSAPKQLLADAAFAKRCQVDGTTFLGHSITWEPYILALWNAKRNSQGWRK